MIDDIHENNDSSSESMEDLLSEQNIDDSQSPEPKAGNEITGTLIQIGENDSFIDYGGRSELPISTSELNDANGELQHQEGDTITGYVVGKGEDKKLTLKQKVAGKDFSIIEQAYENGMPLTGHVSETNKGGFVIEMGGHRAFCPISQIDDKYVDNPEDYLNKDLEFKVTEFSESKSKLVVSRRALLTVEKERKGSQLRETIATGDIYKGTVKRLMPFGAFVDIGGLEGLVHVSEISFERISDPKDILSIDQEVEVKVVDIRNLGAGREERIGLSIRQLEGDPWSEIGDKLKQGQMVKGVITGLAEFGAFVELLPGIRGLIHVSAISEERVYHPADVLSDGQEVEAKILEIDLERKRISLTLLN
jgi:small subunit ribosomal protein S1